MGLNILCLIVKMSCLCLVLYITYEYLKLSLQNKCHSIEEFECWVSTKPFHAFNCSKLHGMKLPLPAVVVNLGLDEGVWVCHVESVGDVLFNGQGC